MLPPGTDDEVTPLSDATIDNSKLTTQKHTSELQNIRNINKTCVHVFVYRQQKQSSVHQ